MDLEKLASSTFEFLNSFAGITDGSPIKFEDLRDEKPFVDSRRHTMQMRFADDSLFFPSRLGGEHDAVESGFKSLIAEEGHSEPELSGLILDKIPSLSGYALVDFGGNFGNAGTAFAETNKDLAVFVLGESLAGSWTQALMQFNLGFDNYKYLKKQLKATDEEQLDFLAEVPGRPLIFTGLSTPEELSYIAVSQALLYQPQAVVMTPIDIDQLKSVSKAFPPKSRFMQQRMETTEKIRLEKLLQKINSFDSKDPKQYRIGIAIQQLVIMDYAMYLKEHGYNVKVLSCKRESPALTMPNHIIYAFKDKNLLGI